MKGIPLITYTPASGPSPHSVPKGLSTGRRRPAGVFLPKATVP